MEAAGKKFGEVETAISVFPLNASLADDFAK